MFTNSMYVSKNTNTLYMSDIHSNTCHGVVLLLQRASAVLPCEASPCRLGLFGLVRFRSPLSGGSNGQFEQRPNDANFCLSINSSAPAKRNGLKRPSRALQRYQFRARKRSQAGSSGTISSAPAKPHGHERPIRASQQGPASSNSDTARAMCDVSRPQAEQLSSECVQSISEPMQKFSVRKQ